MNIGENIRLAWEGLRANKMRALLTMLGIIIGIGSVIAILTVGDSMSGTINNSMSSLGASNIDVYLQMRSYDVSNVTVEDDDLMTNDMIAALRQRYPNAVKGISQTFSIGSGKAKSGHDYANVSITGVNDEYLDVNNITLVSGRTITARDIEGKRSCALVSDKYVDNMFGGDVNAALGKEAIVHTKSEIYAFTIVGIYKYEKNAFSFSSAADKDITTNLYAPISTIKKYANSPDGYDYFVISASAAVDSATFAMQAQEFLNRYYENNDNFQVVAMSMESMMNQVNDMMSSVSIALSVIAGISLLVGGIGVMNIMLVSVTERTREIGTRKALGATNNNIRMQFVVESMIVCLFGGLIGIVFGGALGYLGSSLLGAASAPSLSAILLAVSFSMAIGVFFGYYPANKAAKLDPIEALRYE